MRFDLKWVAVAPNELKLWENDGTGLKIISRCLPGQKLKKKILKIALTPISIAGNMVYNSPHSYRLMPENMVSLCIPCRIHNLSFSASWL